MSKQAQRRQLLRCGSLALGRFAFTLIELLVVVALMATIMLLVLPSFQGITRGSRLRTAAFQLQTTLNLARQAAITQRQIVYVVFPTNGTMRYTAYAPYTEREKYLGEWIRLPQGVIFNPTYRPAGLGFGNNLFILAETVSYRRLEIPFPTALDTTTEILPIVTFRPDGAMGSSGYLGVYLSEGLVEATGLAYRPNSSTIGLEMKMETGRTRKREFLP